jgi:3-deoxy-D-manno-octulosonic-acid transferase
MSGPGLALRLYRSVAPAAIGLLPAFAPFFAKLREGLAGRRDLLARLLAESERVQGCVWVHASSVGEYEQARPVIAALRESRGSAAPPVVVTHFSPSGYEFARKRPAGDVHDYLPFDHPGDMRRLMQAWRPRLLVFVKFDCWPNLVVAAHDAGVPVVLLAGSLQPRSRRLKPIARGFFREIFNHFAHLGVSTEEDRRRFVEGLGVTAPVSVTGDTRADQVVRRWEASHAGAVAARLGGLGGQLLILGSTWPPDEQLWLPVLPELLAGRPDLRIVLVPHEPLPARLSSLARDLGAAGVSHLRLSALMSSPADQPRPERCVLVDSVGVLAEIYRAGTLAYVGGSFTTGVHNTLEPAIAGLPVLFGPVIQNAEEAGELVRRGAGWVLHRPQDALACAAALLDDAAALARAGEAARGVVLEQRGATEKSVAVLAPYV